MPTIDQVIEILSAQVTLPAAYIHIASIVVVVAYLMRDQIKLRLLLAIGDALYITFYVLHRSGPVWETVFWDTVTLLTNLVMITILLRERSLVRLGSDERYLYAFFDLLTPGEFRRVLRNAEWLTGDGCTPVIERETRPEYLYFLVNGSAIVEREARQIVVTSGVFLGEIAFLLGRPATATVRIAEGSRYVRWRASELNSLLERHERVERVFRSLFNRDLASKIAAG